MPPLENLENTPESEPACFPVDTYVHTDQGILEIQYIAEGTLVLARSDSHRRASVSPGRQDIRSQGPADSSY